jgi:hypothetical protein
MAELSRHEAGNGGYGLREHKDTAPVLYSTAGSEIVLRELGRPRVLSQGEYVLSSL